MTIKPIAISNKGNSVAYVHDNENCTGENCEYCSLPVQAWDGIERRSDTAIMSAQSLRDDSIYNLLPANLEGIAWRREK